MPGPASARASGSCVRSRTLATRPHLDQSVQPQRLHQRAMEFLEAGAVEARLQRAFEELDDVVVFTPAQGLHGPPLLDQLWQVGTELFDRHHAADRRERDQHRAAAPADPIAEPATEPGNGGAESRAGRRQQAPAGEAKPLLPDTGAEFAPVID